jgi:protein gp37
MSQAKTIDLEVEPRTAKKWAVRIRRKLADSVDAIVAVGIEFIAAKEALKEKRGEFGQLAGLLNFSADTVQNFMAIARHKTIKNTEYTRYLPPSWATLYILSRLDPPRLELAIDRGDVTSTIEQIEAKKLVKTYKALDIQDEPDDEPEEEQAKETPQEDVKETELTLVYDPNPEAQINQQPKNAEPEQEPVKLQTFNRVNENIGWARWSWNPVTGCLHNCDYCYARDIAERFYEQKFEPTFFPERLDAPANTKLPTDVDPNDPSWERVFTCSMADLFGKWVPQKWIRAVFERIDVHREWQFLCLTKFPQRLAELEWPPNVWAGTTVDRQHRVATAEKSFSGVKAGVKWLSCEPLLEPLKFSSLAMFDWVVIGASTGSTLVAPFAPPFEWVADLYLQAKRSGCKVYLKHNLFGAEDGRSPGMKPIHE